MNGPLADTIAALCEEVEAPRPSADSSGNYAVEVDGTALQFLNLPNRQFAMVARLGNAAVIAEARKQSPGSLLSDCLVLAGARLGKLATEESLSLEPDTGDLILWRRFEGGLRNAAEGLAAAESILNEASFWKQWLGAS